MTEELSFVKAICIFRHGARAPSKPALDTFAVNDKSMHDFFF